MHRTWLAPALALALAPGRADPSPAVSWKGALRDLHGGDASARIELRTLESTAHLYALGPVANHGGEITVLDAKPHVVRLADGRLETTHAFSAPASFLVWAQVPEWSPPSRLGRDAPSHRALEEAVEAAAVRAGVDPSRPFPFLLKGTFGAVDLHVLAGGAGAKPGHEGARTLHLTNAAGTALGFFSKGHEGVFTHRGSHAHLHFVPADGASGHVDDLRVGSDVEVYFPR